MATELLRNKDFSAGFIAGSNPGDGWQMIPATMAAGIDSNAAGKLTFWSQSGATSTGGAVIGPVGPDYKPYPNAQLSATATIAGYNKTAKLRIQIGNTPYAVSATPATQPKILAEVSVTAASGEQTKTITATVPATYDRSEGIYFAVYTSAYTTGSIANATVRLPSFLETAPGNVPTDAPPTAPTNVAVSGVTSASASLTWTAGTDDAGVIGYNVYRNGVKVNTQLVTATTFTDTGLALATTYNYTVRTVDTSNQESVNSTAVAATTLADQPPTAPTGLMAAAVTTDSVDLSWTAGTDDVGVAGYRVYRNGTLINTGALLTATTYSVFNLVANTQYTFAVRTVDTAGHESPDATLVVTTNSATPSDNPPTAPTGLAATKTATTVTLTWTAGTDDHGVAGYRVYRNGVQTNTALVTGTTYTDTVLAPDTEYSYTVRTIDNAGQLSVPTAAVAVTTDPAPVVPETGPFDELAQRVADFLGASEDTNLVAMAKESATIVAAMARSYTRGNGFSGALPNNDELAAVITTATARLVANPEQSLNDVGTVSTRSSFQGFTLAELYVLNRYRVRAQ